MPPVCCVLLPDWGTFMNSFLATDTTAYPDALYLTCSDWPVGPPAGGCAPLYTVRNAGNLVPTDPAEGSVDAALDFALNHLHVRSVVVCGHSGCGAMGALLSEPIDAPTSAVGRWLDNARDTLAAYHEHHLARVGAAASGFNQVDQLAVVNVAIQSQRLGAIRFWPPRHTRGACGWRAPSTASVPSSCMKSPRPVSPRQEPAERRSVWQVVAAQGNKGGLA
ncbi:Probable transmembrane carbonic anhydrase [Mycobacteroides abscessus]|nr:Probable transmembrane carbonic anhydrase [Mycobacteroides abscessus]